MLLFDGGGELADCPVHPLQAALYVLHRDVQLGASRVKALMGTADLKCYGAREVTENTE